MMLELETMKAAQKKSDGLILQNVVQRTWVFETNLESQTTVECLTRLKGSPMMMGFGWKTVVRMIVEEGWLIENLTRGCWTLSGRLVTPRMTVDERKTEPRSRVEVVGTIEKEGSLMKSTKGCRKLSGH